VREDPWGDLAILRGTVVGNLIPVIEGEVLSEALHGNPYPLVRVMGPDPASLLKRVPKNLHACQATKQCLMYDPKKCFTRNGMPECFIPLEGGESMSFVLSTWAGKGYVVIVEDASEFNLG
jgi:hypothetical protein